MGGNLIARRTYKAPVSIEMQLPIVSGASSQNAVATIGEGLLVSQKPPDVQRVPTLTSAWNSAADGSNAERAALDGSTQLMIRRHSVIIHYSATP